MMKWTSTIGWIAGLLVMCCAGGTSLGDLIGASGNALPPGYVGQYTADYEFQSFYRYNIGTSTSPQVVEFDDTKGPWLKELINPQAGLYRPGKFFYIREWVSVDGTDSWAAWTEELETIGWEWHTNSTTSFMVSVSDFQGQHRANYGFADITFENDDTKMTIDFTTKLPLGLNPSDYMIIEKAFIGAFVAGTPNTVDPIVELAEYPTAVPDPASLSLLVLGGAALLRRRRGA